MSKDGKKEKATLEQLEKLAVACDRDIKAARDEYIRNYERINERLLHLGIALAVIVEQSLRKEKFEARYKEVCKMFDAEPMKFDIDEAFEAKKVHDAAKAFDPMEMLKRMMRGKNPLEDIFGPPPTEEPSAEGTEEKEGNGEEVKAEAAAAEAEPQAS